MANTELHICDEEGNPAMRVGGYGVSGLYQLKRVNSEQPWSFHVRFHAASEDKPVVVIYPGYRMRGAKGYLCNLVAEHINALGYSALVLDYGGLADNKSETADDATMSTNIEDARAAVSYLNDAERIDLPISYGVNIAMECVDHNVLGVIGVVPAPDRIQKQIIPEIDMQKAKDKGYIRHWGGHNAALKYTHAMLVDAPNHSVWGNDMRMSMFKPNIRLIAGGDDKIVPASMVEAWTQHLFECGYNVDLCVIDGAAHEPNEDFLRLALEQVVALDALHRHANKPAEPEIHVSHFLPRA